MRKQCSPSAPENTPVCQGKQALASFIKKDISSSGIATAIKVESPITVFLFSKYHY